MKDVNITYILYSFILISSETTKMSKKQVSTNSRAWYETGIQLICGTNYETNLRSKRTKGITSSANKAIFSASMPNLLSQWSEVRPD